MSVSTKVVKNVAILSLSNPPVNGLSVGLRRGIVTQLANALDNKDVKAIVLAGERTFPAGADIAEFRAGNWDDAPNLMDVVRRMDSVNSEKPIVAAIDGVALGGGLELALACNYRVSTAKAKLGAFFANEICFTCNSYT